MSVHPVTARLLPAAVIVAAAVIVVSLDSGSAQATAGQCPASNRPNELVVQGGSGQTAQLGKPFQAPLQAKLSNTNGCPLTGNLAGVDVEFDAPGSGASGVFAGSGSSQAVVGTDADGIATAPALTADDTAGSYTVDAYSHYGSVEFSMSNTAAGVPASIAAGGGTPQDGTVNSGYAQPLRARVTDVNGNPVQGATVSFSIVTGVSGAGASFVGGGPQATATTDSDGLATSLPLVANASPGKFTAVASTDGVSAVATYSLDNHAAADTLEAGSTTQRATIDTRYARPLTARLLDSTGQPIEGATVTFTLGSAGTGGAGTAGATFVGGGSQATALTDANGYAVSPPFTADGTPGDFTATATASGVAVPLGYSLHNLPARLTGTSVTQIATVGRRYPKQLVARVTDDAGRPIDGATVMFTIGKAADGATATFPDGSAEATVTTGAAGRAVAPALQANTTTGSFAVVAAMSGGSPIRYTLRNRAGAPASITVGAGDGQSTPVGSRFTVPLAVTVTDEDGNPVLGVTVTFTARASGPSGTFATYTRRGRRLQLRHGRVVRVKTNAKGIAIAPPFTANGKAGGYVVTVRAGRRRAAFALVNTPR